MVVFPPSGSKWDPRSQEAKGEIVRLIACTLVVAAAAQAASAQTAPLSEPSPAPAAGRKTISLAALVHDALAENLSLVSARASTLGTETSIQAARGNFDPRLDLGPSYTRTNQSLAVDGQPD